MSEAAAVRLTRWAVILAAIAALEIVPRAGLGDAITLIPLSRILPEFFELLADWGTDDPSALYRGRVSTELPARGDNGRAAGIPAVALRDRQTHARPLPDDLLRYPDLRILQGVARGLPLNILPIVIISWAWAVVAVVLNTAIGFGEVPRVLVKVGQSMSLSRWQILSRIFFPAAMPYVFTGLKLGMVYSLIGVIASEFVLSTSGLGYLVSYNYVNFRTAAMYSAMFLILALAILLNWTLNSIERRLYRRG